jgi:hypothetical protein
MSKKGPSGPIVILEEKKSSKSGKSKVRRRANRKRSGFGITRSDRGPPVALGWSTTSNVMGHFGSCNREGLKGEVVGGSQFYCPIQTVAGDTATVLQSPDVVSATGNPLYGFFFHPAVTNHQLGLPFGGVAANALTASAVGGLGFPQSQDPLKTKALTTSWWCPRRLRFRYIPKVGSSTNGSITMAWTSNLSANLVAADVDTPTALEQKALSVTTPVWEKPILDCTPMLRKALYPCNPNFTYGETGSVGETALAFQTCGILLVALDGGTASTGYGRIMVDYEIELYDDINTPSQVTGAN